MNGAAAMSSATPTPTAIDTAIPTTRLATKRQSAMPLMASQVSESWSDTQLVARPNQLSWDLAADAMAAGSCPSVSSPRRAPSVAAFVSPPAASPAPCCTEVRTSATRASTWPATRLRAPRA